MIKKVLKSLIPEVIWKKLKNNLEPFFIRFYEIRYTNKYLSNGDKSIAVYIDHPHYIRFIKDTLIKFKDNNYSIYLYSDESICDDVYIEFLDDYIKPLNTNIKYLKFPLILTSASGIPATKFNRNSIKVHMFHSIVSVHDIYHPHSFSRFDVICCVGPHHNVELKYLLRDNTKKQFTLNTGYEIVDRYSKIERSSNENKFSTILFAPSWHEKNILRLYGEEIIQNLVGTYNVILRPHQNSMRQDKDLILYLMKKFSNNGKLELDNNADATDSFRRSDIMISDYSGVAMEFALSKLSPVIFIDGPKKSFHPGWRKIYNKDGVQVKYRKKLGYIVNDLNNLVKYIDKCFDTKEYWKSKLKEIRPELVYNYGNCSNVAYSQLSKLIEEDFSELQEIHK